MPTVRYRIPRVGSILVFDMPAWAVMCDNPPTAEVVLPNGKSYKVQRFAPGRNQIDLMLEVPADELWSLFTVGATAEGGNGKRRKKQEDL